MQYKKTAFFLGILLCSNVIVGCNFAKSNISNVNNEMNLEQGNNINLVEKEVNFEGNSITVEENTSTGYRKLKVEDSDELRQIENILSSVEWKRADVEMSVPPHIRFSTDAGFFSMWVTPKKDRIEIQVQGESLYQKLTEEESAILFRLVTDEELRDYDRWY